MFIVYIIFSRSLNKFYVGQTNDLGNRLFRHNSAQSLSTKNGIPWNLICSFSFDTRAEAIKLEKKIKKQGIKRYMERNNILS